MGKHLLHGYSDPVVTYLSTIGLSLPSSVSHSDACGLCSTRLLNYTILLDTWEECLFSLSEVFSQHCRKREQFSIMRVSVGFVCTGTIWRMPWLWTNHQWSVGCAMGKCTRCGLFWTWRLVAYIDSLPCEERFAISQSLSDQQGCLFIILVSFKSPSLSFALSK